MQDVLQPWKLYVNTKPQPSSNVLIFHKGGGGGETCLNPQAA